MDVAEILVVMGAVVLIALVLWYFFGGPPEVKSRRIEHAGDHSHH